MVTTAPPTWKATTAGILNIISGALNGLGALGLIIFIIIFESVSPKIMDMIPPADVPFIGPLIIPIMIVALVLSIAGAVFPILGGVYALQRRHWGWALAGSIVSIITIFRTNVLGILATIFVSMAKDEFE